MKSNHAGIDSGDLEGKVRRLFDEPNQVGPVPRMAWRLLKLPVKILYTLGPGLFQGRSEFCGYNENDDPCEEAGVWKEI